MIGGSNIIGSYFAGVLGGRMTKKNLLSAIYLLRSVIIAIFILSPINDISILIFAGFMGPGSAVMHTTPRVPTTRSGGSRWCSA